MVVDGGVEGEEGLRKTIWGQLGTDNLIYWQYLILQNTTQGKF